MERVEKQIKQQFYKAFNDVLTQSLLGEDPDWNWLVRLYSELRDRLCQLTPRRTDIHQEIKESMDVELFSQMIRHDAFKPDDMWKLVNYVFAMIKSREAPVRNKDTELELNMLYTEFNKEGITIAKFVPLFLKTSHARIDVIEKDKTEFLKQFT